MRICQDHSGHSVGRDCGAESSKGPIQPSRLDDGGRCRGTAVGEGQLAVGCVQTQGRGQSQRPPRASRMQPPHVTGRGGAAVGRRDGGPCAGAPGGDAAERFVTGFGGPGGGARLDIRFTMDCKALGLREGTWDRGHQGESPGAPVWRGQERRGKAPRTGSGEAGVGREGPRAPPWKPGGKAPQEGGRRQSTQRRADRTN